MYCVINNKYNFTENHLTTDIQNHYSILKLLVPSGQCRSLSNLTRSLQTLNFKVRNLLLDDGCYNEVSKTPTNKYKSIDFLFYEI